MQSSSIPCVHSFLESPDGSCSQIDGTVQPPIVTAAICQNLRERPKVSIRDFRGLYNILKAGSWRSHTVQVNPLNYNLKFKK